MEISWLSVFADVPEPLVDRALEFWAAVTASTLPSEHRSEARSGASIAMSACAKSEKRREAAGDRDQYLPLAGDGEDPYLWIQRVHRPESDGGWHPDLYVDDLLTAVRRAVELGAGVFREVPGLVGLTTPAGQPFCLIAADGERRRARPRRWPGGQHSLLDQICLDIPAATFESECRFWSELTGWPRRSSSAEFVRLVSEHRRRSRGASTSAGARSAIQRAGDERSREEQVNLARPGTLPLRILLQQLGEDDGGPARAHADLACDDRPAEQLRHQGLGAELVRIAEHWTTLRDPAGLLYCITDRNPFVG